MNTIHYVNVSSKNYLKLKKQNRLKRGYQKKNKIRDV